MILRAVFALLVALVSFQAVLAGGRPNIIFMIADDQRYDAMSCVQKEQGNKGRFPWFKTPNMDRIAAKGVRFRNAFVVNALCSPSRASFLTGQYSHKNGIWNNTTPLGESLATHASLLRAAGYCTGYIGKWHMGMQAARPGFDWFASPTGQSKYVDPIFLINGKATPLKGWQDDLAGDFAVRFLESERDKNKPFLLCVGFKAPHGPFQPPDRWKGKYDGQKARKVPNFGLKPSFNPHMFKEKEIPADDLVPVNLSYFECVAAVDENVGKILEALERLNLSENTIVIYVSDNGFYFGEHSLADKRSAYEESIRIPFLVRDPRSGVEGVTRDDMILNIDLAPTLLDFAGLKAPVSMQGQSFKALLGKEVPREPFRASFLYTYFFEKGGKAGKAANPGGFNTPTLTAARTTSHVLIRYANHPEWTELFDLKADPYQIRNLFASPEAVELRRRLEMEHDRLVRETGYHIPKGAEQPQ